MTRPRASVVWLFVSGGVVLGACGGAGDAKSPAKVAEPPEEREPSSVADAQAQIERARAELARAEKKKTEADKDSISLTPGPSGGAGASTGSTTTTRPRPSTAAGSREESMKAAPADPCAQSCRAISSMRRAVSALCRMTGEEDARCSEAKRTLQDSESRVAQCHCAP